MHWNLFHQIDGGWQWEYIDDGEVQASGRGFATHAECMADAVTHGYAARLIDDVDGLPTPEG
jgi:hypothetical protein